MCADREKKRKSVEEELLEKRQTEQELVMSFSQWQPFASLWFPFRVLSSVQFQF